MNEKGLNREVSIIYDLLFGYTDKMKKLREELNPEKFNLPVQMAVVIKIITYPQIIESMSDFQETELKREISIAIKKEAGRFLKELLLAAVDEDTFVLFFSLPEQKEIKEAVELIKERLEEEMGYKLAVGLGRKYDNLKGLIFSYKEALNACKTANFMGIKGVLHIDDLVLFKNDVPLFITEKETVLMEKLKGEEYDQMDPLFQEIFDLVSEEWIEPEVIKTKLMELFYKIIKESCKDEPEYRNPFSEFTNYLERIIEARNQQELSQETAYIFDKIMTFLRNKQILNKKQEIKKALAFIEENYQNSRLSLGDVSEEVGLSLYYFSHLFKKELGESFVTYLNKVRINRAKEILATTSLNIAETCYRVGYNDPNYFTRVFKDYEGVTPSEFRRKSV